jgi:hypothetical protein
MKRGPFSLHALHQTGNPIQRKLVLDPGQQETVALDLCVEFDTLFTRGGFRIRALAIKSYDEIAAKWFQESACCDPSLSISTKNPSGIRGGVSSSY